MQAAADAAAQVAVDAEEEALSDSEGDGEDPLAVAVEQVPNSQPARAASRLPSGELLTAETNL